MTKKIKKIAGTENYKSPAASNIVDDRSMQAHTHVM